MTLKAGARERHKHYLQQALRCVTDAAYFYWAQPPLRDDPDLWSLDTNPKPIELERMAGGTLYLAIGQSLRVRYHKKQWRMSTQQYIYNVAELPDSPGSRDYLFAWHWHPELGPQECHLHANAALSNGMRLDKKHLPTARVSLEEVLRFLISECDVFPARDDWQQVLDETQRRYEQHRTWAGSRKP